MPTSCVVKQLDVFKHALSCGIASFIELVMHAFFLQGREEAFHHGVVPAVRLATHAAGDVVVSEQISIRLACVLRSSIKLSTVLVPPV